jgi:VWFA-related protein
MPIQRSAFVASVGAALICAAVAAAQPPQNPTPAPPPNRQVFRLGVELVQVDAVVTDARGRHITDLTAEDFEVLQDGRLQQVSTFAYVPTNPASVPAGLSAGGPPGPIRALTREQVRRTIAIVVDDLSLSFESAARARDVLKGFLDKQMQRGDLVAILKTGSGSGALQQFTSDRRILDAAVDRVRWNTLSVMEATGDPLSQVGEETRLNELRDEMVSTGALGTLRYIVRGIADLPGRKAVVLLSDGLHVRHDDLARVMDLLQPVIDAANRAGVVVYTLDTRGLFVTGPRAADPGPGASAARAVHLRETQDAFGILADETGGLFLRNSNDLTGSMQRALDDQQGYYLLGYVPAALTFKGNRNQFHTLSVRVKRKDLRVRSRKGFFGVSDRDRAPQTPANRMAAAVMSPFAGGDVRLRLSSFFALAEKTGPVVLSVMHVDARDLTFTREADGMRAADAEVLAVTFDEDGRAADQNSRRFTFRMAEEAYTRALNRGFVYRIRVPLKRPGPYQMRVALRDVRGDRIGSASQFIEIPDVKKGRLALSGLVIDGSKERARTETDNAVDEEDPGPTVALRTFRQGTDATYFCEIYNAQRGRDGKTRLDSASRLFRDGVEIFKGTPRAVEPPPDPRRPVVASGILQFLGNMTPGSYILQLSVTDRLAKKHSSVTQTIDFEVVQR